MEAYTSNLAPLLVQIKQKKMTEKEQQPLPGHWGLKFGTYLSPLLHFFSLLQFVFPLIQCISSFAMYLECLELTGHSGRFFKKKIKKFQSLTT